MKKIYAIVVIAMMTITAQAQVFVGGGVGFNSVKVTENADATKTFSIMPEVGYNFNDQWTAGVNLGFTSVKAGDADATNAFGAGVYGRYHFCQAGNLKLFAEVGADFTTYNNDGGNNFSVALRPGLTYSLTDNWSITAKTGVLGYSKDSDKRGGGSAFGVGVDNSDLQFSLYYNF